ncbi:MAG: chemotaxis protein CheW [Methanospirillum sp.]|uniref:chemotaxis protein CheW n=1 Tax=Methanospirillum sp. TaxID=45200 RepID=UPI002372AF91|nr:chemotaxis protein CheW [Methanospirillum sp.]MDD1729889.1 chemotaxis protein CheW [Methanospirillum sp.]
MPGIYTVDDKAHFSAELPVSHVSRQRTHDEKVIEFIIGSQAFAMNLSDTKEVISRPEITPLPGTASYIRGITDLRGLITTVIDIRQFLSLHPAETQIMKERVIILDPSLCQKSIGILVDDVRSVQNYQSEDIDLSDRQSDRYQSGVIKKHTTNAEGKSSSELILLLDIKKIVRMIKDDI